MFLEETSADVHVKRFSDLFNQIRDSFRLVFGQGSSPGEGLNEKLLHIGKGILVHGINQD
jgi:hypothetical protein